MTLALYNQSKYQKIVKAYLTPYGVGLGHASRLVMIAGHLQETGVRIRFSSFGEAVKYVSMQGYECMTVPAVEFAWNLEGSFSIKNSIAKIPFWFANFSKQVNYEARNMTQYDPSVIVSDSRLSPLLAAKLLGIPSVVILNQVKLLLSPRLREFTVSRFFEKMIGEFLGIMWNLADRVLVPDLPPPYTIAENNVWQVSSASHKLEYIGFTAPKPNVTERQINEVCKKLQFDRSKPVVFIHISGPAETRLPLIKIAIEASKMLEPSIQFVISEGKANGTIEPRKIAASGWYYEWCPVRDEIFAMSDVLVLRGGHVAISQAIQFGKPIVTIPIENHGEQLGNSEKVAKLGFGIKLSPKRIRPEEISNAIHNILNDPKYREKAEELMKLSESLNGINNVVQIIKSYL